MNNIFRFKKDEKLIYSMLTLIGAAVLAKAHLTPPGETVLVAYHGFDDTHPITYLEVNRVMHFMFQRSITQHVKIINPETPENYAKEIISRLSRYQPVGEIFVVGNLTPELMSTYAKLTTEHSGGTIAANFIIYDTN
jgi:hypothetical protein